MKTITELKERYNTVTFEGIEYVLCQDAYAEYRSDMYDPDEWWCAKAIREDELNKDGEPTREYRIWWRSKEDVDCNLVDEISDIVDFGHPYEVETVEEF